MANYYELQPDRNIITETTVEANGRNLIESTRNRKFERNNLMRETSTVTERARSQRSASEIIFSMKTHLSEFQLLLNESLQNSNRMMIEPAALVVPKVFDTPVVPVIEPVVKSRGKTISHRIETEKSNETELAVAIRDLTTTLKDSKVNGKHENGNVLAPEELNSLRIENQELRSQNNALTQRIILLENNGTNSIPSLAERPISTNGEIHSSHVEKTAIIVPRSPSTIAEKRAFIEDMMDEKRSVLTVEELEELRQAWNDTGKNNKQLRGASRVAHTYKKYSEVRNRRDAFPVPEKIQGVVQTNGALEHSHRAEQVLQDAEQLSPAQAQETKNVLVEGVSRIIEVVKHDNELTPEQLQLRKTKSKRFTLIPSRTTLVFARKKEQEKLQVTPSNGSDHKEDIRLQQAE